MRFKRSLVSALLALIPSVSLAQGTSFPAGTVWGNDTAAARPGKTATVTAILDRALGSTRGSILERGASAWAPITPGTSGFPFVSNGAGADPAYQRLGLVGGGTGSDLSATGGTSQFLRQNTVGGAITPVQPACADLSNASASCTIDTRSNGGVGQVQTSNGSSGFTGFSEVTIQNALSTNFLGVGNNIAAAITAWTATGSLHMPPLVIARTLTWQNVNDNGMTDLSVLTSGGTTTSNAYASYSSRLSVPSSDSQPWAHLVGYESLPLYSGTGGLTEFWGHMAALQTSGSVSITNGKMFYARDVNVLSGTPTITNLYGFYVDALTKGANNYAFFSAGTTPSSFGGIVSMLQAQVNGCTVGTAALCTTGGITASGFVSAGVGFRLSGTATNGHTLVGNGTNFVDGTASNISNMPFVVVTGTVNFSAAGDSPAGGIAITLPPGYTRYFISALRLAGASANISAGTIGVFMGAGGTGANPVAAGTAVTVTSTADATANNAQTLAVASSPTVTYTLASQPSIFPRVGTTTAGTASFVATLAVAP